jgi:hypothetical protein
MAGDQVVEADAIDLSEPAVRCDCRRMRGKADQAERKQGEKKSDKARHGVPHGVVVGRVNVFSAWEAPEVLGVVRCDACSVWKHACID